jgi:hypothetical protein
LSAACKTIGILALGLELVSRNTWAYLDANKVRGGGGGAVAVMPGEVSTSYGETSIPTTRTTRRMNAWQQHQQEQEESLYYDQPVRQTRRRNAWQQAQQQQIWD